MSTYIHICNWIWKRKKKKKKQKKMLMYARFNRIALCCCCQRWPHLIYGHCLHCKLCCYIRCVRIMHLHSWATLSVANIEMANKLFNIAEAMWRWIQTRMLNNSNSNSTDYSELFIYKTAYFAISSIVCCWIERMTKWIERQRQTRALTHTHRQRTTINL